MMYKMPHGSHIIGLPLYDFIWPNGEKKHQRQSISLETKIAILDRLGKGEGSTAIGKHFNLGESTVKAIKKNEAAMTGESATADEGAAKIFPEELAKIIEDGDYSANQKFNADETGLYWKKIA
ncbi:hypothetical protein TNCV_3781221 [Trichonephila clavipes]|nr:hypothetical protein TNCV_3781221 [Trichonephila clavipes]